MNERLSMHLFLRRLSGILRLWRFERFYFDLQDGNNTGQRGGDAQLVVTVSGIVSISEPSLLPGPSQAQMHDA